MYCTKVRKWVISEYPFPTIFNFNGEKIRKFENYCLCVIKDLNKNVYYANPWCNLEIILNKFIQISYLYEYLS